MEFCMEVASALKSSLRRELAKTVILEELCSVNSINTSNVNVNGVVEDNNNFAVDCFLDFSQQEDNININNISEEEEEEDKSSVSSQNEDNSNSSTSSTSSVFSSHSFLHTDFSEPVEELKELEWVSQFVDDSMSEPSLICLNPQSQRFEPKPEPVFPRGPCFALPSPVPVRTRTKRQRTTRQTWSILSEPASFTGSYTVQIEPPSKKTKRKYPVQTGSSLVQRKCSHCQIQKTPQWRAGPLGPKTLCNACGVRFKSGRLYPEYRPACSPTFCGDLHSNSHRKVLEMRRKKESVEPELGLIRVVHSF
ncbi:hypothetical protein ACFE04_002703 [Oxalis oulophora]